MSLPKFHGKLFAQKAGKVKMQTCRERPFGRCGWVGGWKPVGKPAVVAAPTRLSLSLSALFRENFDTLHFCTAHTTDSVTVPLQCSMDTSNDKIDKIDNST